MTDIRAVMLEVAQAVADRAKADEQPPFAEQIDALKALTAMYTAMQKHPAGDEDDETDGFDFSKGVNAREETDGSTVTTLRARRRPD